MSFAPELRFLLQAVRAVRGGSGTGMLRATAAPDLDWNKIVEGIGRHGLSWIAAPLLAAGILPAKAAAELRRRLGKQALMTLERVQEAGRVARAFDQHGIRFLMVKGAPLSVQLYGDATVRPARDIDILIERGKVVEVDAILTGFGYTRPAGGPLEPPGDEEAAKEIGYVHPDSRILVEVHDRLTDNSQLLPWDFDALWAERETVSVGGQPVPTMARHRLPLYLCVHGAKHCWGRLIWLQDLAGVLDTPEAIARAMADAEPLGLRAAMLHSLAVLHDWFGCAAPEPLLAEARASRHARLLTAIAVRYNSHARWYEQSGRHSWRRFWQGSVQSRLFAYAMKPRWPYWRRQLAIELISPADRAMVTLPPGLTWLYVPIRPFGWMIRRMRRG
jgi:hypothetical protein